MRRSVIGALLSTLLMVVMLLFAACEPTANICVGPDGRPSTCAVYTCSNGTPSAGRPSGSSNVEQCASCESTYRLIDNLCNMRTSYTCSGGTPRSGLPAGNSNIEHCTSCTIPGATPDSNNYCLTEFNYICTNGTPQSGTTTLPNTERCSGCNMLYNLNASNSCEAVVVLGGALRISAATLSQFGVSEDNPFDLAAIGNILYMVGADNDRLYRLNTTDGSATPVGSVAAGFGVGETFPTGLAALGTTLYMVGTTNARLYRLNLDTTDAIADGSADQVGNSAAGFGVNELVPAGLATIGTTLYMLGANNDRLYSLNTTDGSAAPVGIIAASFGVGERVPVGLAALGTTLYMVGRNNDVLYSLNIASGSVGQVGSVLAGFGVGEGFPSGLAAIGNTLYMVGQDTDALYALRYQ